MTNNFDMIVRNLMQPTEAGGGGLDEKEAIAVAERAGEKLADETGLDSADL
jgi:hypothetical protein